MPTIHPSPRPRLAATVLLLLLWAAAPVLADGRGHRGGGHGHRGPAGIGLRGHHGHHGTYGHRGGFRGFYGYYGHHGYGYRGLHGYRGPYRPGHFGFYAPYYGYGSYYGFPVYLAPGGGSYAPAPRAYLPYPEDYLPYIRRGDDGSPATAADDAADAAEGAPAAAGPGDVLDARGEPARLVLSIEPDAAAIYLDDRFVGLAGELDGVLIDAGAHRLQVVHPSFDAREYELTAEPGEEIQLEARLETPAGSDD